MWSLEIINFAGPDILFAHVHRRHHEVSATGSNFITFSASKFAGFPESGCVMLPIWLVIEWWHHVLIKNGLESIQWKDFAEFPLWFQLIWSVILFQVLNSCCFERSNVPIKFTLLLIPLEQHPPPSLILFCQRQIHLKECHDKHVPSLQNFSKKRTKNANPCKSHDFRTHLIAWSPPGWIDF